MSLCSQHRNYAADCAACNAGIVDCPCGKKPGCSQRGGKGWFMGSGKPKYQKLEDLQRMYQAAQK